MERGSKFPSIEHYDWVGKKPKLSDKPILVLFWSISCHDCKIVLHNFIKKEWYLSDAFDIVSVHMPRSKKDTSKLDLNRFCEERKISFPVLIDNDLHFSTIFRNQFVPTIYIFSKDKVLLGMVNGSNPFRRLEYLYRKYLQ